MTAQRRHNGATTGSWPHWAAAVLLALLGPAVASAQGPTIEFVPPSAPAGIGPPAVPAVPPVEMAESPYALPGKPPAEIVPVGCAGCSSGLLPALKAPPLDGPLFDGLDDGPCGNGCGGNCVPGRYPCYPHHANGPLGKLAGALYECICCPDPCYEGKWCPLADAAFFTEAPRPISQTRFRYDSGQFVRFLDRAEYFWARADGNGKGPPPTAPLLGPLFLRYNDLVMVAEGGTGALTVLAETRYRSLQADPFGHAAGFTDTTIGTKTLLYDCELLQLAMLFRTYIPSGNFRKGLGTGHVSLEPGLLLGVKLSPTTYLQTQLSEWIPLGGDQNYQGSVLALNWSVNQEIYRLTPDVPIIATFEGNTLSFQDGQYTDPFTGPSKASGVTYVSLGGGMRLFVCDRIDMGVGALFAVTGQYLARQQYRAEFRVRF